MSYGADDFAFGVLERLKVKPIEQDNEEIDWGETAAIAFDKLETLVVLPDAASIIGDDDR